MQLSDFRFELPEHLIAQVPTPNRTASRLLTLDGQTGVYSDKQFVEITELIGPDDLLVFNNTRVIPARLLGQKSSGGRVEVLVERLIDTHTVLAHVRASKSPKTGTRLQLESHIQACCEGREGDLFRLRFEGDLPALELLIAHGRIPLPPYIERHADALDAERYQTVFAKTPGAVAAPTAGLHFDRALLDRLRAQGVAMTELTLHVGAGTFQPVRVDDVTQHHMHAERIDVPASVVDAVAACRARGGRVVAVGTTCVRALESAAQSGKLLPFEGETAIFIYPGYAFQVVDAMITNFHLSESTLLMLVSAFAGREQVLQAYAHAVSQSYRFFSYGDAMFITRKRA